MSEAPGKPRRRWYLWVAGSLLLLVVALASLVAWLALTESGLRQLARLAERASGGQVVLAEPSGRLVGPLRFGEVRVVTPDLRLRAEALELDWNPRALFDRLLDISSLSVRTIEFASRPEEAPEPLAPPESLSLPLAVSVDALRVGRLAVHPWAPEPAPQLELTDLSAEFHSDGRRHRLAALDVMLPVGRAELAGEIDGGASPFPLSARGALRGEREGYSYALAFTAAGDLLAPQLSIDAEGAGLFGKAEVLAAPFAPVPLRELHASIGGIDPSAFRADAPRAQLSIEADLRSESADRWVLAGPVLITNEAPASIDRGGLPFERLAGRVRWTPQETGVDELVLALPGKGRITGDLEWQPEAGPEPLGRIVAELRLQGVQMARLDSRLPPAVLAGKVEAAGDAANQTAKVDLRLGRARIQGEAALTAPPEPDAARRFTASGDLARFNPRALLPDAPEADLNLAFKASGTLADVPKVDLALKLRPSELDGRTLDGEGRVRLEGERLAAADVDLTLAGNRVQASGAWGAPGDRLAFDVDAPALGALHEELSGRARLEGTVSGTLEEPSGELRLFAEALTLPGGLRLSALNAQGQLEAGLEGPFELALGITGLGRQGEEALVDTAAVSVTGSRGEHRLELSATGLEGDRLQAALEGGLAELPAGGDLQALRWSGRLIELETAGRLPVRLTEPAEFVLSPERIALGRAVLDAGEKGRIRLEDTVWTPETIVARGGLTGLAFGLTAADEGRPRRGPGPLELGAQWDLRLGQTAEGEARIFRESGDLVIEGEIPTRLGLEELEARIGLSENRVAASWEARGERLGRLTGSLTTRLARSKAGAWGLDPDAALLGSANLSVPSIAWVGRLVQENLRVGGSLEADFSISGTPAEPVATGRITGQDLAFAMIDQGLSLSGGELLAEFDRDRLRLERLEFVSPNRVRPRDSRVPVARLTSEPGRLAASGEVALDSGAGRFVFRADRLPLLQRPDRWAIVSGEGEAKSTWTSLDLAADMRVDAGYVELAETPPPALSDDVVIVGEKLPEAGGFKLSARVGLSLGNQLYLSALGVDTRLTGSLTLRLRDGQPLQAVGTVATAGGTFRGYGQNLTIERGLVNFQGPIDNPGLNVVALRKGLEVEAGVAITGSARRPQIRLVSEPDVPDPVKLSWLVLGRPPQAGSGADLGLLMPAAQALFGGPGGGGMTDQLSRSLGLDELSIGQGELGSVSRRETSRVVGEGTTVTGDATVSGQVLSLGKRLSSDLFLAFEQSLGGAESLVKLTYQLTRRVSVVARSGSDNSADIYYTISFK